MSDILLPNNSIEAIVINKDEYVTDLSVNRCNTRLQENDLYLYQKTLNIENTISGNNIIIDDIINNLENKDKWDSCYNQVGSLSSNWGNLPANNIIASTYPPSNTTHEYIPSWINNTTKITSGYMVIKSDSDYIYNNAYYISDNAIPTTNIIHRALTACLEAQRVYSCQYFGLPEALAGHDYLLALWGEDKRIYGENYNYNKYQSLWSQKFLVYTNGDLTDQSGGTLDTIGFGDEIQYVIDGGYTRPVTAVANTNFTFDKWSLQKSLQENTVNFETYGTQTNPICQIGIETDTFTQEIFDNNIHWYGKNIANFIGAPTPITFQIDPPRLYAFNNNLIDLSDNTVIFNGSNSSTSKSFNYWSTVSIGLQIASNFTFLDLTITPTPDLNYTYDWPNDFSFKLNKTNYNVDFILGHTLAAIFNESQFSVKHKYLADTSWTSFANDTEITTYNAYSTNTAKSSIYVHAKSLDDDIYGFKQWSFIQSNFSNDITSGSDITGGRDISWRSVCYGNGKFVAVGQSVLGAYSATDCDKQVMYSTDGESWTLGSINIALDAVRWSSVCYGNGKFVAVNEWYGNLTRNYPAMYSTDGITWTLCNQTNFTGYWQSVTWIGDKFVAVGATHIDTEPNIDASIMYSTDGITWTKATNPIAYGLSKVCWNNKTDSNKSIIATVNDVRRYTGYAGDDASTTNSFLTKGIIQSVDGINWTAIDVPTKLNYLERLSCAAWNFNDNYFVVGIAEAPTNYRIMTSTNALGTSWVFTNNQIFNQCNDIQHSGQGGVFAMFTGTGLLNNKIYTSIDGASWNERHIANNADWMSLCYGNGAWIGVSSGPHSSDQTLYIQAKSLRVVKSTDNDTWIRKLSAQIFDITDPDSRQYCPILKCSLTTNTILNCDSDYRTVKIKFYCVEINQETGALVDINVNTQGTLTGTTSQEIRIGEYCTPVTAVPATNYIFDRWETGSSIYEVADDAELTPLFYKYNSTSETIQVLAKEDDAEFYAIFQANPKYTITIQHDDNCTTNIAIQENILQGESSNTITATAKEGYYFKYWEIISGPANISPSISSSSIVINNINNNITIKAISEQIPAELKNVKFVVEATGSTDTTGLTITDNDNNNVNLTNTTITKAISSQISIKANSSNGSFSFKGTVLIRTFNDSGTGLANVLSVTGSNIVINNIQDHILVKVVFIPNIICAPVKLTYQITAKSMDNYAKNATITESFNARSAIKTQLAKAGLTLADSDVITSLTIYTEKEYYTCFHCNNGPHRDYLTWPGYVFEVTAGGNVTIGGHTYSCSEATTIPIYNNHVAQALIVSITGTRTWDSQKEGGGGWGYNTGYRVKILGVCWKPGGTLKEHSVVFETDKTGTISIVPGTDLNKDVILDGNKIIWSCNQADNEQCPQILATGVPGKTFSYWSGCPTAFKYDNAYNKNSNYTSSSVTANDTITAKYKKG